MAVRLWVAGQHLRQDSRRTPWLGVVMTQEFQSLFETAPNSCEVRTYALPSEVHLYFPYCVLIP